MGENGEDLYEITAEDYMLTAVGDTIDVMGTHSPPEAITDCALVITNIDLATNEVYWVLGQIFMRKIDVIFDLDNERIGFVRRNDFPV